LKSIVETLAGSNPAGCDFWLADFAVDSQLSTCILNITAEIGIETSTLRLSPVCSQHFIYL